MGSWTSNYFAALMSELDHWARRLGLTWRHNRLISRDQVNLLYANAPLSQGVALANSSLVALVQWPVIEHRVVPVWLGAMVLATLARLGLVFAFKRARPNMDEMPRWGNMFIAGAALSGLIWGAAGIFLFPESSGARQVLIVFVLAGMVAGGMSTLSIVPLAFALFCLPAMIPITVRYAIQGDTFGYALSWMMLVYTVAVIVIARRLNRTMIDSLSLRYENTDLIERLTLAKDYAEGLNARLLGEIAERKQAEKLLLLTETAVVQADIPIMIVTAEPYPPGPTIVFINQASISLTGYTEKEAVGQSLSILHGPKTDRFFLNRLLDQPVSGECCFFGENISYRKDGTEFKMSWRIVVTLNETGQMSHLICLLHPIPDQLSARKLPPNLVNVVKRC